MGMINPAYEILEGSALRDTHFSCKHKTQNLPIREWVSPSTYIYPKRMGVICLLPHPLHNCFNNGAHFSGSICCVVFWVMDITFMSATTGTYSRKVFFFHMLSLHVPVYMYFLCVCAGHIAHELFADWPSTASKLPPSSFFIRLDGLYLSVAMYVHFCLTDIMQAHQTGRRPNI